MRLFDSLRHVGQPLPPHLSPFVDNEEEGYLPRQAEKLKALMQQAGLATNQSSPASPTAEQDSAPHEMVEEEELRARKVLSLPYPRLGLCMCFSCGCSRLYVHRCKVMRMGS